jgi:hypothetical protein
MLANQFRTRHTRHLDTCTLKPVDKKSVKQRQFYEMLYDTLTECQMAR